MLSFFSRELRNQKHIAVDPGCVAAVTEGFDSYGPFATILMQNGEEFTVQDENRTTASQIAEAKDDKVQYLATLQKIEVSSGDRLVFQFNEPQPPSTIHAVHDRLRAMFPECTVLIVTGGSMQIEVIKA